MPKYYEYKVYGYYGDMKETLGNRKTKAASGWLYRVVGRVIRESHGVVLRVANCMALLPFMAFCAVATIPCIAGYVDENDFSYYEITDDTVALVRYSGSATHVTIPASIQQTETYKDEEGVERTRTRIWRVVQVGSTYSYYGSDRVFTNATLQSVSLPNSVRTIGADAFVNCTSLSQISLANVTYIGHRAFSNTGLTSVSIPNLEYLGEQAFYSCKHLTEVTLGGTAVVGDYGTFDNCEQLKKITIGGMCTLPEYGRIIYGKGSSTFDGCTSLEEVYLGEGVTNIPENMFKELPSLRKVQATPSLVKIESGTYNYHGGFVGCTNLVSFNAFPYLKEIGRSAFRSCSALAGEVNLQNVETIGFEAFANCSNIVSVTTGTNVCSYSGRVFRNCASLKTVELYGNGTCTLVGTYVDSWNESNSLRGFFSGCSTLETCRIGDGISAIVNYRDNGGYYVFDGCDSLREVYFGKDITDLSNVKLQNHGALEICHFPCATNIPASMFSNCTNLNNVSSLTNIQTIGGCAFLQCQSLCGDLELSSIRTIGDGAFLGCTGIVSVVFGENLDRLCSKDMCYYWGQAFEACTNAETFVFMGPPPTNACYRAFAKGKVGAHGYYQEKYSNQWEEVIDVNGMWKGLIMGPAKRPKLEITKVEWDKGSATLDWSHTETGAPVMWPCSLYRGTSEDFSSATKIVEGTRATSYVDADFLATRPKTGPLFYWVVPDGVGDDYDPGEGLATRRRFGLFVGFSEYEGNWEKVYPSMWRTTKEVEKMFNGFGFETRRCESPSSQELSSAIAEEVARTDKGDIFVLWIYTHGGKEEKDNRLVYWLSMKPNRDRYFPSQLANDLSVVGKDTAVVPIIYACHSGGMLDFGGYQGGFAACSEKFNSPAVSGAYDVIHAFGQFLLDSKDHKHQNNNEEDNGDGDLTLHEMVKYIQQQQEYFTRYSIAQEYGTLNDVLVMKENDQRATGLPPDKPTGLLCEPKDDGSVVFSWNSVPNAKWYSDQGISCDGDGGFWPKDYYRGVAYNAFAFTKGRPYKFTVYAGNEYGSSEDASIDYIAKEYHVMLEATKNRADGIKLTWNKNNADSVDHYEVSWSRFGPFYDPVVSLPGTDTTYLDIGARAGENKYEIKGYDNSGKTLFTSKATGERVDDYSLDISIKPSNAVPLSADFKGKARQYFSIGVTANAAWTYSLSDTSFCGVEVVDGENYGNGRIYLYCLENDSTATRRTVLTVSMKKSDGSAIRKQCEIVQLGKGETKPYEGLLSRYMQQNGVSTVEEFMCTRDSYGVPLPMCYAFQGNLDEGEIPKLTIFMDADGNPCVCMPKQNPDTALDVDVRLESSTDLHTWNTVFEDIASEPSQDGRSELHFPRKSGKGECFRFKVDLR